MDKKLTFQGTILFPGFLDRAQQQALADQLRAVAKAAPMFHPETPGGQVMSVKMTSAGACGWVSDANGYRYAGHHPNGHSWPKIPDLALSVWETVSDVARAPDCCLINYYGADAKMGLHQDRDEASFDWPVVSISLGDEGLFRVGGTRRGDPTKSVWLKSGDVVVMSGAARLAFHGVDRIKFASSTLLPKGGRLNVTMRVVT